MSAAFILIVMTVLEGGALSAAFVNVPNAERCAQRAKIVRAILTSQNVKLRELDCFKNSQKFEKFSHNTNADAPRYPYLIELGRNGALVSRQPDVSTCENILQSEKENEGARRYCVTSTQALLTKDAT